MSFKTGTKSFIDIRKTTQSNSFQSKIMVENTD